MYIFSERHIWDLSCVSVLKHVYLSCITMAIKFISRIDFCGVSFNGFDADVPCRQNNFLI